MIKNLVKLGYFENLSDAKDYVSDLSKMELFSMSLIVEESLIDDFNDGEAEQGIDGLELARNTCVY